VQAIQMSTSLIQVQMNVMNLQSSIQSLVGELGMRRQLSTEQKNQLVMSIILMVNMLSDLVPQDADQIERQQIAQDTERGAISVGNHEDYEQHEHAERQARKK
jgi:hypothetical protein